MAPPIDPAWAPVFLSPLRTVSNLTSTVPGLFAPHCHLKATQTVGTDSSAWPHRLRQFASRLDTDPPITLPSFYRGYFGYNEPSRECLALLHCTVASIALCLLCFATSLSIRQQTAKKFGRKGLEKRRGTPILVVSPNEDTPEGYSGS